MSKLSLPPPRLSKWAVPEEETCKPKSDFGPPPYGKRSNFSPNSLIDYGDGGAFPEIHMPQYPLNMGKISSSNGSLALETSSDGKIKYDLILSSKNSNTLIKSSLEDLTPMDIPQSGFSSRPSEEQVKDTTARTRAALEAIVDCRAFTLTLSQNTRHPAKVFSCSL